MKKNICAVLFVTFFISTGLLFASGRDGTGPQGLGPGTGRRQGPCFDNTSNSGQRFGATYREISKDEQREILSSQLKNVDVERIAILKELENMEND